jgi:hypothetical protein
MPSHDVEGEWHAAAERVRGRGPRRLVCLTQLAPHRKEKQLAALKSKYGTRMTQANTRAPFELNLNDQFAVIVSVYAQAPAPPLCRSRRQLS